MQVQEEHSAGIRTVSRSHDGGLPVEELVTDRTSTAGRGRVSSEIGQFLDGEGGGRG